MNKTADFVELVAVWRDIDALMNAYTPRFRSLMDRAEYLEMRVQLDNPRMSFARVRAEARAA